MRSVTPDHFTSSSTSMDDRDNPRYILSPSSPSGGHGGRKAERDRIAPRSVLSDEGPSRPKQRTQKGSRKISEEPPLSSSPSSLLSKTRTRLNSITTPFKGADDQLNSFGHPSLRASPVGSDSEGKTQRGSRRHRLVKHAPSVASTEGSRQSPGPDVRPAPIHTDSGSILQLMKTTCGRMHGLLSFRLASVRNWSSGYCVINVASGSLTCKSKSEGVPPKTLIPDLRGCKVSTLYDAENEGNYLFVATASSGLQIHLKPPVPETFDSWLAALLCWQPIRPKGIQNKMTKIQDMSFTDRRSTEKRPVSQSSSAKNIAIIKVGKMLLWEGRTDRKASQVPAPPRVSTYKQLRALSTSWQRVSCTLLENGVFKLLTESDAQTVATIPLSALPRCAIQQLHPSVLEDEHSLAIYPQYSAYPSGDPQPSPIYVSLESRVLYEVWYVLLRAFTIPQLYGPEPSSLEAPSLRREHPQPSSTNLSQGLFRVERSLSLKMTDAKFTVDGNDDLLPPNLNRSITSASRLKGDFYAEIVLDGEPQGRTTSKPHDSMLWAEDFLFSDLPPVISSAVVLLKTRNPDDKEWTTVSRGAQRWSPNDINHMTPEDDIEVSSHDTVVGKIELQLDDMERGVEVDQRWPLLDSSDTPIGNALMKLRLSETVVLMKEDYSPLLDLLRNFSNGLTLTLAKSVSSELRNLSEILLDIFQVCGDAADWIMVLVEDEIDGLHQQAMANRTKYTKPSEAFEKPGNRELLVRDLGKSATIEANLLFRGNTLLTKTLDAHMRRLGKEYLEETIGEQLRDIDESDPDCEVNPNKLDLTSQVTKTQALSRNWRNLSTLTVNLWTAISSSADRCPLELRQLLRYIKSCAETRYGDFLRTVAYSSVSGFLFLRFFCPAILNPQLFGLLKGTYSFTVGFAVVYMLTSPDKPRPRAHRTLTLIAKSLQGLANMTTFGEKERWMEPMNKFLQTSRPEFKDFVNEICSVPSERPSQAVSASYATPIQILGRLPPTSREGFPSLPFLIDSPRSFASLITLWLSKLPSNLETRLEKDATLRAFHEQCVELQQRTKDCLNHAEPAERPSEGLEFQWERLLEERERVAALEDEVLGRAISTDAPVEYNAQHRETLNARRRSNGLFISPRSRHVTKESDDGQDIETPMSSASLAGDQPDQRKYSQSAPRETLLSTTSSVNSSSVSLDVDEITQFRPSPQGREVPVRNRLVRDFVSGAGHGRGGTEEEQFLWSGESDEF